MQSKIRSNIKALRTSKAMTQTELALAIDTKRATLGAWEEGRSEPKLNMVIAIANFFQISIDDLLKVDLTKLG
jgi:DNA-binding XRE family transcriptional regulator